MAKLLGELAIQLGLLTKDQLIECLLLKEQDSTKPLGRILLQKHYITLHDLERLLKEQKKLSNGKLFGEILIEEKLATPFQVNEALRIQGMLRDMNIKPVLRLGEILLKKKFITKEQLDIALSKLSKELYACDECGIGLTTKSIAKNAQNNGTYTCKECNHELSGLIVDMVFKFEKDLDIKSDKVDVDLPADVLSVYDDESKQFGDYILVSEVGEGGSGVVYKAWDKKFNRYVALKMLSHDSKTGAGIETPLGDAEDLRRFYLEMTAVSELLHPNIIPVYDSGVKDSYVYFVMEFINGVNLEEIIKSRKRDLKKLIKLMIPVCDALDYAHSKKICHRDLKPTNILIDREGKPWILDFGLASVKGYNDASPSSQYVVIGTPYYMSPEQASGQASEVDERSDIYSIGAILYHISTNRAPFSKYTPEDAIEKVIDSAIEPPSAINGDIGKEFEDVILKTMNKDRSKRYQKIKELSYDLQCILNDRRPVFCYHASPSASFFLKSFIDRDKNRLGKI